MPEYIGPVEIPEISTSGSWPITLRFGMATVTDQRIAVHRFGSNDTMTEQRFIVGSGARRISIRYDRLPESEYDALLSFYSDRVGSYQPFLLDIPRPDATTEQLTVRFASPILSLDQAEEMVYSGTVELLEEPTTAPTYTVSATQTRFPSSGLQTALLAAVQEIIPLVKIVAGAHTIYLSDRRVTVGGNLYQPRLLDWQPVTQSLGGASDSASFTLGNADRVFTDLVNLQDLAHARIEFSLFHVGTTTKLDFWAGHITGVEGGDSPEFRINAADALYELRLPYPRQTIDPQGGFSLPNQPVNVGGKKGIAKIRATSVANDSAYGKPLRDIYVSDSEYPMPVECDLIAGRDESEFFAALGVVGRGPISGYASGDERWRHLLDGQPNHGPGALGLRRAYGGNPTTGDPTAANNSPDSGSNSFALDETGNPLPSNPLDGVAFIQIRRTDDKGIQPARADTHKMTAYISGGLGCWTWTAPGSRSWTPACTNPVWIAVNVLLRGRGLETASAATQEAVFDCAAAITAAATCDTSVTPIIGDAGSETQFRFTGRIEEQRPLREWIEEILNCSLGYSSFVFDKLRIGLRINSYVVEAFTLGNVVYGSVGWSGASPQYNSLRVGFADRERGYAQYQVHHKDSDAIARAGKEVQASLDVPGVATKSQAARLAITRLREEMGGLTEEEQRKAGLIRFRTTILALNTEPGQVCSLTHPSIPGGACEFRVTSWRLNRDWSVDIEGRTTTDSMYDYTIGDKPADIQPDPLPEIDRQDLYPGDVTLGTITQAVVEDSNGVKLIELSIPYTPPSVTRGFVGVAVRVERPGIKSEVYDFDYSETAPAEDTERLRFEPPSTVTESWTVRVTSRSNVLRRPFSGTTPSQTLSVDPVEAITSDPPEATQPGSGDWSIGDLLSRTTDQAGVQWCGIPITVTIPADAAYVQVWTYRGASPPSSPSLYRDVMAITQGTGPQTETLWLEKESAEYALHFVVTASTGSRTTFPGAGTPVKSVVVPALSLSAPVTSSSVEAVPYTINGQQHYRLRFNGAYDTGDENLQWFIARWRETDSDYLNPGAWNIIWYGAPGKEVPGSPFSVFQPDPPWPAWDTSKYFQAELGTVNWAGEENWSGALSNLPITTDNKVSGGALKNLIGLAVRGTSLANLSRDLLNGDFEDGLSGWTNYFGGLVTIETSGGVSGGQWCRLAATGQYVNVSQNVYCAVPGAVKRVQARLRNETNHFLYMVCVWMDANDQAVSSYYSTSVSPSGWQQTAPVIVGAAPSNAAYLLIYVELTSAATSGYAGVDAITLEDAERTSSTVGRDSSGNLQVPDGSLTSPKLVDRTILGQKIALEAITTAEIAASIDPPIFSATPPGAVYLGRRYATYSGILYEWTGSAYRKVVNSTSVKSELALDKLTSDHLAANSAVFGIVAAGAIGADQMRAVEFLLKGDGSRPPRWLAKSAANADIAMIGQYGGEDGLWAINGRFGGSWAAPAAQFSSSAAALNGVDFTLVKNGVTTSIKNDADPLTNLYGLSLAGGSDFSMHAPGRFFTRYGNALAEMGSAGYALFRNYLGQNIFEVNSNNSEVYAHKLLWAYSGAEISQYLSLRLGSVLYHASRVMIDSSRNIGHGTIYNTGTGVMSGVTGNTGLSVPTDLDGGADLSDVISKVNSLLQALRSTPPVTSLTPSYVQKWIAGYTAQTYGLNYEGKIPVLP